VRLLQWGQILVAGQGSFTGWDMLCVSNAISAVSLLPYLNISTLPEGQDHLSSPS